MTSRVKQILAHVSGSKDELPRTKMSDPSIQVWQSVPLAPPDSIFKLTASYKADTDPQKVNLGVGAYRDDDNKPWILPSIKEANKRLLSDESVDHEYLPILGLPEYTAAAARLMLSSDSPAIKEGRAVSVQTISGTGANHLGALFLSKFYQWNGPPKVYLSNPTWANHHQILKNVGIEPVEYPYYDPKTIGLDFAGMKESINTAVPRSVFLLHACAHNPTGVDPTPDQWAELADLFIEKGHYAFFDCAYQGFASGDLGKDAGAVRYFESRGVPMLVCQSFAKNAGLYGERVGALHVLTSTKDEADRVRSQLSILQRSEISNPPAYGARLIALLLNDEQLFEQWKEDIKTMAFRIIDMRKQLHHILTNELQTPGNWDHIISQIGMFSFTGISPAQANAIIEKAHVYMTGNGRISMAGLNSKNIRYFAESLDKAVRGTLEGGDACDARVSRYSVTLSQSELGDSRFPSLPPFTTRYYSAMPPKGSGKEKAAIEEEDEILQAVILADSFNSRFGPLTMELPRCLLPVCNTPLLDWTFEALASAGVQQVYVFCSSHAGLIRQAINDSPWSRPASGLRIIPITSREARSVGDALREIDTKQIIASDFVLVSGDIVSNIRIDEVVKEHRERRKISKDAIMTTVVREIGSRDRPQSGGDATVIVMDAETSQCVHYEYIPHGKTDFDLPGEVIAKHRDLDVRIDLLDCGIDICSPDVPALFSENFDYQDLRKDFVRGVLTSDLLSKTIHCYVATRGYAARVKNTKSYAAISKDIITRRTFPLVPDDNHLGGDRYDQRRGYVYVSKNRVSLSRTCVIGNHTIIGAECEVMNDVHISSSVLGKRCEIGNRTTIRNSFIWDKTRIGADCIIEDSIIGAHVRILDGSVIRRGCLVGQNVTLGPNATLDKFQRVSRHPPANDEDEDEDEDEEEELDRKEDEERDDDDDGTDEDKSVIMSVTGTESSAVSVEPNLASVLGQLAKAYLWPAEPPEGAEGETEDIESPLNIRLGRIGDHGSDVEYEESDVSDLDTVGSSPLGSPLSASSATSAGLINNIPTISLDSSADFLSECRQSLDRAYQEGHSIDNAAIELKTLRMASNVPLKRVAESIVGFLVGKIELVDAPAAQRVKVNAVVSRWGPLLTSIGWDDAAETISLLQRYCALNIKYQKIFGLVLASFYNDDIVEFDDIKSWYGRNLALKKQGLDDQDPIGATLEDTMQQAMRLIQQIHSLEQEDDDDDDESDEEEEEAKPQPSARTAPPPASRPKADSDDDSDGEGATAPVISRSTAGDEDEDDEGEATETEDEK